MTFQEAPATLHLSKIEASPTRASGPARSRALLELSDRHPIFIGFKLDGPLRRCIEAIAGPDRRYVSAEDSTYLRICRLGDQDYVGKVIHERLTTDRVDDVRRNVVSILQRLCPDIRLAAHPDILACASPEDSGGPDAPTTP